MTNPLIIMPESRKRDLAQIRHFNRFYTNILGVLDRHYLKSAFSLSEGRVLFEIYHHPGCTAIHIKTVLNIDEAYLSRILNSFVKQGLITRTRMHPDGRAFALKLTRKGEKEFRQLNAASDIGIGRVTEHLSDKALGRLVKDMTEIEETLSQKQLPQLTLEDTRIRTELRSGDLGMITYLHGKLYRNEYDYGLEMEAYIAEGLAEFYKQYDPARDCVWICEHHDKIIGSLFLMHRDEGGGGGRSAQLRYFLIDPAYRGLHLGSKLMDLYMDFLKSHDYDSSYLWTLRGLDAAANLYKRHGFVLMEEKETMTMGRVATEQRYDLYLQPS